MAQAEKDQRKLAAFLAERFPGQDERRERKEETPVDTAIRLLVTLHDEMQRLTDFFDERIATLPEEQKKRIVFESPVDAAILLLEDFLPGDDDEEDDDEDDDDDDLPTLDPAGHGAAPHPKTVTPGC